MEKPVVALVIPAYDEEPVLRETARRLGEILRDLINSSQIGEKSFCLFVDDGSTDRTWQIIRELNRIHSYVKGLRLSRNFGHQSALMAGLARVKNEADCIISIDADLQQDEKAIYQFIDKYHEGYDIVYGVRTARDTDNFFKRTSALLFYSLMKTMGVEIVKNHADYRLISKRVLHALSDYGEVNLFLRGLFPILGFKQGIVSHEVRSRFAGKSKYSLKKMVSFALNGITSFSIMPMRMITFTGFTIFSFSVIMGLYALVTYFSGKAVIGWASTVVPIYFIGGVQLLSMGLIGEYIGKIYMEVKKRPRFIIEEEV
jgi:polyisoprenyl-phosphate glycosyltransferase